MSLVLLDTDHLSILQMRNQPFCDRLEARLASHPAENITASIVSFQENVQGWLAWIKRAKKDAQIIEGYAQLQAILRDYCDARVLPFDTAAQSIFANLQKKHRRTNTLDLRIACVALANQAILLTRNKRDFDGIDGLTIAD